LTTSPEPSPLPDTPAPGAASDPSGTTRAMDASASRIADWLRRVRKTARTLLVAQRIGWIVAGAILAIIVGGFADYFLRAPMQLRLLGLLLALGTLIWCFVKFLLPAVRFRPSLAEIALRVERSGTGGAGQPSVVRGLLASALELGRSDDSARTQALAAPVVAEAADKLTRVRAREVFSPRPTFRAVGAGVAAFLLFFGLSVTWPQHTQIGLARMLFPWSSAQWPKHTEIADATRLEFHPLGAALEFRAALVKSDRDVERTNIAAHYRVITGGSAGPERKALLSPQPRSTDAINAEGMPISGTLFERLIEPTGLTTGTNGTRSEAAAAKMELEYWFESDDDATPARRILLVDPPAVVHAAASVTLPEYAAKMLGTASTGGVQTIDLGAGSDDRAAPAPILAGSHVSVTFEFNKPLQLPASMDVKSEETARWIQSTMGPEAMLLFSKLGTGPSPEAKMTGEGRTWTLSWQHWDSVRLLMKPTDEYHITAAEDAAFRFDALKDNPPTATVTTPAEDKSVLATAIVEIAGEARDDVALDWVALERQLARKNTTSESNAPEAKAERVEITRVLASEQPLEATDPATSATAAAAPASIKRLVTTHALDLSTIPELQPGDELWITALATDAFNLEGQRHEAVRSTIRKLRILSREQLVEQIWSELSSLRRTAIKIDQDQQDVAKVKPPAGPTGEELSARAERAQAGLTERMSRQNQSVTRLQQRVKENGLTDQNVQDVLKQASESLARAGEHSAKGSQNLGEAARQQSQESAKEKAGEPELNKAAEEQKAVRDELSNLIDMLDQGEDSFASKRSLERLLDQQKELRERTGQTGRQTAGKTSDQLSPEQQAELDKIAQEQKALADQLRDQVRKMQERQSKVREKDAAAAEAMSQAAAQATRDQTPERMDEASKQAQKNQTSSSQQQQTEAIQSMEQMLQKMEQAQKNKDEVLKRALATLIDSLKGLIQVQEVSIAALKDATPKGSKDVAALERPMIAHLQNVLGVMEQANTSGAREIGPVVEKIEKASDKIGATIPELREGHAEQAMGHEDAALDALKEALSLAEKLNQNAEQKANARKRAELRAKYEQALKTQTEIRDSTQGLVGAEDNRRTKATARKLGEEQIALNAVVDGIRDETKDIAAVKTFLYAHKRLDELMAAASASLSGGTADAPVLRNQTSAARVLKSLADALDDRKPPDDPFRGQQGGGGGQGGGSGEQPTVPDAAEIVLLRLMQIEALDMARGASEAKQPDAAATADAAKLQREIAEQGTELLKKLQEKTNPHSPGVKAPKKPGAEANEKPDEKPAEKPDVKPEAPEGGGEPK
jgi:hypothetical protein